MHGKSGAKTFSSKKRIENDPSTVILSTFRTQRASSCTLHTFYFGTFAWTKRQCVDWTRFDRRIFFYFLSRVSLCVCKCVSLCVYVCVWKIVYRVRNRKTIDGVHGLSYIFNAHVLILAIRASDKYSLRSGRHDEKRRFEKWLSVPKREILFFFLFLCISTRASVIIHDAFDNVFTITICSLFNWAC